MLQLLIENGVSPSVKVKLLYPESIPVASLNGGKALQKGKANRSFLCRSNLSRIRADYALLRACCASTACRVPRFAADLMLT